MEKEYKLLVLGSDEELLAIQIILNNLIAKEEISPAYVSSVQEYDKVSAYADDFEIFLRGLISCWNKISSFFSFLSGMVV